MNPYELMLIFDPGLGEEKIGAIVSKIEEKIAGLKGEINKTEKWGIRSLASMMKRAKKLKQGYYVLVRFSGETAVPGALQAYLKVTENIVRYSILKVTEMPSGEIKGEPLEEKDAIAAVDVGEISGTAASAVTDKGEVSGQS